MYRFLEGYPPNVLAMEADGKVTAADYRDRLIPKGEAMMAGGPIKALVIVRNDITDYSLGAMWQDELFGLRHWRDVSHLALVTDHAWMKTAIALLQPFYPGRMRVFPLSQLDAAKTWITSADPA